MCVCTYVHRSFFSIKYLQNNYRTRNLQTASIDIDTDWWNKRRKRERETKKRREERREERERDTTLHDRLTTTLLTTDCYKQVKSN